MGQIKDIYTGKITNWNQVGGPNLKITAYSRRFEDGGTVEFLVDNVLGKEKMGSNVVYVYDTTDGLKKLASDRGGIYYASAPEVVPQCQIKLGLTQNISQTLISPCPLRLCGSLFRNSCVSPVNHWRSLNKGAILSLLIQNL